MVVIKLRLLSKVSMLVEYLLYYLDILLTYELIIDKIIITVIYYHTIWYYDSKLVGL